MYAPDDAVIASVARTPIGKFRQALAGIEAPALGGHAIRKAVADAGIEPGSIDEVVFANLFNYDWGNSGRVSAMEAGLPVSVPALSVNRQCGSSLDAVSIAAMMIRSGSADIVVAGGVESYSRQPFMVKRSDRAFPAALETARYRLSTDAAGDPSMIETAENVARKYGIARGRCDEFALASHRKAAAAWARGFFDGEVVPIEAGPSGSEPRLVSRDECVRADASLEALARLKPVMPGGVVTAGNASPMNDGASALVLMSARKASELGLEPLARVAAFASAGLDPNVMGLGPVFSTRKLLARTGLTIDDFDLIELNEAFAAQSLACVEELRIDESKLNPNGGAIALGHPNAASGGILVARAVRYMRERGYSRALVAFCCGGGQGVSCALERV